MRVLITGSRDWDCLALAELMLSRLIAAYGGDLVIVHGACGTGVDQAFADACEDMGILAEPHPADWSLGRGAGPARNSAMVALGAAICIALSRDIGRSRGTRDCAMKAYRAGIRTFLVDNEAGVVKKFVP